MARPLLEVTFLIGALYSVQRSFRNGAAMRVTAIGYAFNDIKPMLKEVKGEKHE